MGWAEGFFEEDERLHSWFNRWPQVTQSPSVRDAGVFMR